MRHTRVGSGAVFLLFSIFVSCVLLVLCFSARAYEAAVARNEAALTRVTAEQYLLTKLRGCSIWDSDVHVEDLDGRRVTVGPVLVYSETIDGEQFVNRVYVWDGRVYELFSSPDINFVPGDGDWVLEANELSFKHTGEGVQVCGIVGEDEILDFYFSLATKGAGEYESE